jgi:hypothetical protein
MAIGVTMALTTYKDALRAALVPGDLHILPANPRTVHWGYFDPALAPALTVRSGDLIRAEAITHHAGDAPDLMMDAAVTRIFSEIPPEDRNPGVHIMTGPIFAGISTTGASARAPRCITRWRSMAGCSRSAIRTYRRAMAS